MKKRIISSFLIVFILAFRVAEYAYAEPINSTNNYSTFAANYSKYDFSSNQDTQKIFEELINSNKAIKNENINGIPVVTYDENSFIGLINDCAKVNYVQQVNNAVYISYVTNTGEAVIIVYDTTGGIINRVVYDAATDTATFTDELHQIYLVYGNFSADSSIKSTTDVDETNSPSTISPSGTDLSVDSSPTVISSSGNISLAAITNPVDTYRDPTADFPMYTKSIVGAGQRWADSPIYDYVKMYVKETMNDYRKITLSPGVFAATTTLTVVAAWLSLPMTSVVTILTVAGVLISGYDYISNAVSLYKSAVFQFNAAREGYVYDPTTYRADVKVWPNFSYGQLSGGYDNTGHWRWIISSPPSAWSVTNTTIYDKIFHLYLMDVTANGRCTMYYPD